MKAVHCTKYGPPEVLKIIESKKPSPKEDEVLVRVHAASVNAYDVRIMRGSPAPVRLREGLINPKDKILGADIAGTVEVTGKNVTGFAPGDLVYGCLADSGGDSGFAEYAVAKGDALAPIPQGIAFAQAAAVPMAAVTALQGLRDVGGIRQGQRVLINGASGGVGTFAVQLSRAFGAEVTGVCSGRNAQMVRKIGADAVINYEKEDFTESGRQYDLILDIAANHSLTEIRRALKPGGICAVVGFSGFRHLAKMMLFGKGMMKKEGKRIEMVMADNRNAEDLVFLNGLLSSGEVVPVIDGCYPLADVQKAFTYFENTHAKGKIVLKMEV